MRNSLGANLDSSINFGPESVNAYTVWPSSLDPFDIVSSYIKWIKTSLNYSIYTFFLQFFFIKLYGILPANFRRNFYSTLRLFLSSIEFLFSCEEQVKQKFDFHVFKSCLCLSRLFSLKLIETCSIQNRVLSSSPG